jgi:arsenate reductase-like glutaredoxin family protein
MIENQPNEITLIYHSDKAEDKKARAFIETISGYTIKAMDLKRDRLTETLLAEIAHKMSVEIGMLFDSTYKDRFESSAINDIAMASDSDLLTILIQQPVLIKTPIAIVGKKAYSYASAYELLTKKIGGEEYDPVPKASQKIVF